MSFIQITQSKLSLFKSLFSHLLILIIVNCSLMFFVYFENVERYCKDDDYVFYFLFSALYLLDFHLKLDFYMDLYFLQINLPNCLKRIFFLFFMKPILLNNEDD